MNFRFVLLTYGFLIFILTMLEEFSFCFESQWAELLAMRFCPFLLLCSRVGLKRREESFGKRPLEVP